MKACCKFPFENVVIEENGYVCFCCSSYNNHYYIGNIFENTFEEIWYGDKAIEFRKSVLDKSYKYCDLDKCAQFAKCNIKNLNRKELLLKPPYPKKVYLSHISSCNVKCVMCRDKIVCEKKKKPNDLTNLPIKLLIYVKMAKQFIQTVR